MICVHCGLDIKPGGNGYTNDYIHSKNGFYNCVLASGKGEYAIYYAYPLEKEEMALTGKPLKTVIDMGWDGRDTYFNENMTYLDHAAVTPFCIKVGKKKLFANSEKELRNKFEDYLREEEYGSKSED